MGEIFISHAAQDAARASQVANSVRLAGHGIFLDYDGRDGVAPGTAWQRALFHELRICDAVVFLNSGAAQASMWCHSELVVAAELGKRVYSVDLEPHLSPHPLLRSLQGITFNPDPGHVIRRLTETLEKDGLAGSFKPRWNRDRPPYPGLAAMDVADAGVFFGREEEVRELTARVEGPLGRGDGDLLIVMGPSGAGKSSLVRAGLVARLGMPGSGWMAASPFEPGTLPLERLISQLAALAPGRLTEAECRETLEQAGLAALADRLADHRGAPARRLLITLDQAEQLVSVTPPSARDAFCAALASAMGPGSPVTVVMTTRSDRFDELQRLPAIGTMIRSPFVTAPMDRSALAAIIEGPASRADLAFEPGLVARLMDDTTRERGESADALPLLAFALREMYDLLTLEGRDTFRDADYERIGRIDGAIARRAVSAENTLPPESRPALDRMLTRFVALDEERPATARPVPRGELSRDERIVADRLEDQRLLTGTADAVRLAHERLIIAWPRLKSAVDEHRDDLLTQARVERQAKDWKDGRGALLGRDAAAAASSWLERTAARLGTVSDDVRKYIDASRKALRRSRMRLVGAVSFTALLAVGASVFAAVALVQRSDAITQSRLAQSEQLASEALNTLPNDAALGMLLSLQAYERAPTLQARSALVEAGQQPLDRLLPVGGPVYAVAFSPDRRTLATGGYRGYNGDVDLWDTVSKQELVSLPVVGAAVNCMAFNGHGSMLAVGDSDGHVGLWDVTSEQKIASLPEGSAIDSVAFSPDGRVVAVSDTRGDLSLWDVASKQKIASLPEGSAFAYGLAFSPDGHTLAAGDATGYVDLWDVASKREIARLPEGKAVYDAVAFSPDGHTLAAGEGNGHVGLWDVASKQKIASLPEGSDTIDSVAFSPDGHTLATGDDGGHVGLWDVASKQKIASLPEGSTAWSVAFSPDGHTLAAGDDSGHVRLWDPVSARLADLTQGNLVNSVAFSPDGHTLAVSGGDVGLWDAASGRRAGSLPGDGTTALSAAFSRNGQFLAVGYDDGYVGVRDMRSKRWIARLREGDLVHSVAFSPDGHTLAVGDDSGHVSLWNVASQRKTARLPVAGNPVNSVAFNPDGSMLATGDSDDYASLWGVASKRRIAHLPESGFVGGVAFSRNGRTLAVGTSNGDVDLWDVASKRKIISLPQGSSVNSVAFSPDGRTLAVGDHLGNVNFWNTANDQQFLSLPENNGGTVSIAFSPRDQALAIGGENGDVALLRQNLHDLTEPFFKRLICGEVRDNLTRAQWADYAPGQRYQQTCPLTP